MMDASATNDVVTGLIMAEGIMVCATEGMLQTFAVGWQHTMLSTALTRRSLETLWVQKALVSLFTLLTEIATW